MALDLSFPLRLLPNGEIATVEQRSADGDREAIVQLVLTRLGERPLNPGFGMPDPTFGGFEPTALAAALAIFGPPVRLTSVEVSPDGQLAQRVHVEFE